MSNTNAKWVLISKVKQLAKKEGSHWFDPKTMEFFLSKVGSGAFETDDHFYFVSSEQFEPSHGPIFPRLYTARMMDKSDATVDEVPGTKFQQFRTEDDAWDAIKDYLEIED